MSSNTKQTLIETALMLLWKNSYGAVSVDDICKAADVKKGSFYHFFPSKIDLAIAAMEEASQGAKEAYDQIFSTAKKPVDRFTDLADFIIAKQEEAQAKYGHVCGCPCAALGSEIAAQEQGIREKFEEFSARQEKYFETAIADMVAQGAIPATTNVKATAREVYTYILGQLMVARIENDLQILKQDLKPGLLRLLGSGISPTPTHM